MRVWYLWKEHEKKRLGRNSLRQQCSSEKVWARLSESSGITAVEEVHTDEKCRNYHCHLRLSLPGSCLGRAWPQLNHCYDFQMFCSQKLSVKCTPSSQLKRSVLQGDTNSPPPWCHTYGIYPTSQFFLFFLWEQVSGLHSVFSLVGIHEFIYKVLCVLSNHLRLKAEGHFPQIKSNFK